MATTHCTPAGWEAGPPENEQPSVQATPPGAVEPGFRNRTWDREGLYQQHGL